MWITQQIHYKKVRVYKDTLFGRRERGGYELTAPLEYEYKGKVFRLDVGYVWDGPSIPKFVEWIVGERNLDSLMAASAFHDTADNLISISDEDHFGEVITNYNISDAATFYREMIKDWPNRKVSDTQAQLQYIGLLGFQWIYTAFNSKSDWKKVSKV